MIMGGVERSLEELESRRAALLAALGEVGDFRRGSVSESYRRCGKSNCACARPEHPGHGPRASWTRRGPGGKTVGRMLAPGEVDKVRGEVEAYHRFRDLADELAEVNEAICEARPVAVPDVSGRSGGSARGGPPGVDAPDPQAATGGQKGGSRARSSRSSPESSATGSSGRSRPRSAD